MERFIFHTYKFIIWAAKVIVPVAFLCTVIRIFILK
jgi:hypothetical protein